MLLHRYFGSHVLKTLRDRKLKVSKPSDFNDPFEFYFKVANRLSETQARTVLKNEFRKTDSFQKFKKLHPTSTQKDFELFKITQLEPGSRKLVNGFVPHVSELRREGEEMGEKCLG